MPRLLNVFVCYNFFHYMRNTLESCLEFFPSGDILIIDNASTNEALRTYLAERSRTAPRVKVIFREENNLVNKVGSLYSAYNLGISYALEQRYDYVHVMNDDVQFMWRDDSLLDKVEEILRRDPKVSNVSAMFQKRITRNLPDRLEVHPTGMGYLNREYAITDEGVLSAKFLSKTGFRYQGLEREAGRALREQGYRTFHLRDPVIAFVPWPATRRHGRIVGAEMPPRERYYLKPLTPAQVSSLTSRPVSTFPTIDDYCFPWSYACLSPYWFTTPSREYFDNLWINRKHLPPLSLIPHYETRGLERSGLKRMAPSPLLPVFVHREPRLFLLTKIALWPVAHVLQRVVRPLKALRRRAAERASV